MASSGKTLVKAAARPILRPLLARMRYLNARIDAVEANARDALGSARGVEGRIAEVEQQLANAQRTFSQLLDTVAQQNALARETRRAFLTVQSEMGTAMPSLAEAIARVERRIEFVRKEVMLEVRYGSNSPGEVPADEPIVVDREKLEVRPLRLNLGCGHIPLEGYVNVDGRELTGVDLVAEVGNLPFEPGSVDEIRSAHMLEHFPTARLEVLLKYWFELLRPGGGFIAVVPDAESMIHSYVSGEIPWDQLKEVTFGGQEYSGDFHFTMFSQDDVAGLLASAGFSDIKVIDSGRPNGDCLEMEVVAYKPPVD